MHRPDYGAGRNRLDPVEGHEDPSTSHSVLFELTKWGTLNGLAQQIEAYGAIDSLTTIRERVSSPSELPLHVSLKHHRVVDDSTVTWGRTYDNQES